MPFPRIYKDEPCPLEGYEGFSVRVLQNSTNAEWQQWQAGNLGAVDCPECVKLQRPPRGKRAPKPEADAPRHCASCRQARDTFGLALVAFFGPGTPDLDFSTPERALATVERDDLPEEILTWLMMLPGVVRARRTEELLGNLTSSLTTPPS